MGAVPRAGASAWLHAHPATPCAQVQSLQAQVARQADGRLHLHYVLQAPMQHIALPAPLNAVQHAPTDGLWQHTCFEAFIAPAHGSSYVECNFAPSGAWAWYDFVAQRKRRQPSEPPWAALADGNGARRPQLHWQRTEHSLTLDARLPPTWLPDAPDGIPTSAWRVGLTAVIEPLQGPVSYWALHHPGARPDFHQPEGWLLHLTA